MIRGPENIESPAFTAFYTFLEKQDGKIFKTTDGAVKFKLKLQPEGVKCVHLGATKKTATFKKKDIQRLLKRFSNPKLIDRKESALSYLYPVYRQYMSQKVILGRYKPDKLITDFISLLPFGKKASGSGQINVLKMFLGGKTTHYTVPSKAKPSNKYTPKFKEIFELTRGVVDPPPEVSTDKYKDLLKEKDPPRSSYALLSCKDKVIVGETFTVRVGLSAEMPAGVSEDQKIVRPDFSRGPYMLDIQIIADGFQPVGNSRRSYSKEVTAADPYPIWDVSLTARPQQEEIKARSILVTYSTKGHTMGVAVRSLLVLKDQQVDATDRVSHSVNVHTIHLPSNQTAADLTIRITHGDDEGDLLWTLDSPHQEIKKMFPQEELKSNIGHSPEVFARQLMDKMNHIKSDARTLYKFALGIGKQTAKKIPQPLKELLNRIRTQTPTSDSAPPTLLIISQDPYVPWELALLPLPGDRNNKNNPPPFLSTRFRVGRWVLDDFTPEPPQQIDVLKIAVISGEYDTPEFENLEQALEEAGAIQKTYGAIPVSASQQTILDCLDNNPAADILHFAVHGVYAPDSVQQGLITTEGKYIDPLVISGSQLESKPFVFLNACQVGTGSQVLGDYAGMAAAFIEAGASGVVAPLWSVNDTAAKETALEFYKQSLQHDTCPSEILRTQRAGFTKTQAQAEKIAYVYFGHPVMKFKPGG